MIGAQFFYINSLGFGIQIGEQLCLFGLNQTADQLLINFRQHLCVIRGSMVVKFSQLQCLCHTVQLMPVQIRQH